MPGCALAFVAAGEAPDYGTAFARLRWRRAVRADAEAILRPWDAAADAFAGAEAWTVVLAAGALPARGGGFPDIPGGSALAARAYSSAFRDGTATHTLRELEAAEGGAPAPREPVTPAAIAFRPSDFPPLAGERVDAYLSRVTAASRRRTGAGLHAGEDPAVEREGNTRFAALEIPDPSERERIELSSRMPAGRRRLVDVGCGAGATSSALRRRRGADELFVTGVERDAAAAARARGRLDRVLVGDAARTLSELADRGERFDAFLFGDVLEHTGDPAAVLSAARAAAFPGASLVASVPNAGHLSIVRDLVLGRFDPVPAGLADAGHLRWFTRSFLAETLAEAGWRTESIEGEPGAAPPDAAVFLESLAGWPGLDASALLVYQWIAVATAA